MASISHLAEEEETCLAEAELQLTSFDDQARHLTPTSQRVPGCLCWGQERSTRRATPGLGLVSPATSTPGARWVASSGTSTHVTQVPGGPASS